MTPSIKKVCIFALAAGVPEMLLYNKVGAKAKWRGAKLAEAGDKALKDSHININGSLLNRAYNQVELLYRNKCDFDIAEFLCVLLCGVDDLAQYHDTAILRLLNKRALWFLELFDPKLDKTDIYEKARQKYAAWTHQESF